MRCHAADWEFLDTFILIVKRKKVSLLQSYHHSGAVIAMWLMATSRSHGAIFFVCVSPSLRRLASTPLTCMRPWLAIAVAVNSCMNSFVHTIMYGYYASSVYKTDALLTSASYRLLLPLKPYLTTMQITQVRPSSCTPILHMTLSLGRRRAAGRQLPCCSTSASCCPAHLLYACGSS